MAGKETEELSPKEEAFVRARVKGMSQRQAYREAYPHSKAKDATIDTKASLMWKKEKVRNRYKELVAENADKAIWTREMAMEELKWLKDKAKDSIEEMGVRQANSGAFINAVKELNLLGDVYPKEEDSGSQENDVAALLGGLVKRYATDD